MIKSIQNALQSEMISHTSLPDGTGVLLDINKSQVMELNETADWIVRALLSGQDRASIIRSLIDEFEVNSEQAEKDLDDFLIELAKLIK